MTTLPIVWDVHTVPVGDEPVRHFQPYPDEPSALRAVAHLSVVLSGQVLVADPIKFAAWTARLLGREVAG